MKATVNKETCTGCELCVQTCPDVFQMDDDGLAKAVVDSVPDVAMETCREAAESCPVEAIALEQ